MEAQKVQTETNQTAAGAAATSPKASSCRKMKRDDATFIEDVKDHIDEFLHASMAEHKDCFQKTMQQMFGMMKKAAERNSEQQEVESVLPLQTTVSN